MPDQPYDPAPFKANIRALARYLAGQGYDYDAVQGFMAARQKVTGWTTSAIEQAVTAAIAWAQRFRDALDYKSNSPIQRGLAAVNADLPRAYRYGVMYVFGDGEARTVLVHSDVALSAAQVLTLSRDAWYERARGSPGGRLGGYSPYNTSVGLSRSIESISIVTYERRTR